MGEKRVERYETVSAKIQTLPKNMSSEWYFAQLQDVKEEIMDESAEGGKGQPGEEGEGEGKGPGLPGPGGPCFSRDA